MNPSPSPSPSPSPPAPIDDEAAKKRAFEAQRQRARAYEQKKRRVMELEKSIATGERELETMRSKLKEVPEGGDWERLAKTAQQEQALAKRLEAMMSEWAKLSEEVSREGAA